MHTINWCNWLVYYDNEDDDVDAIQTRDDAPGPLLQLHKLYIQFAWPLVSHLIIIKIAIPLNLPIKPLQRVFVTLAVCFLCLLLLEQALFFCYCTALVDWAGASSRVDIHPSICFNAETAETLNLRGITGTSTGTRIFHWLDGGALVYVSIGIEWRKSRVIIITLVSV